MTISAATIPAAGATLAQRVIAYFAANREEELSTADIVRKFDVVNGQAVHAELASAVSTGQLARMTGGIYAAGPNLIAAPATAQSAPTGVAPTRRGPTTIAAPIFDPEAVAIVEGVDRPRFGHGFKNETLRATLPRLFARMTANSHAVLDIRYRASAQEALRVWRKGNPKQQWGLKADPAAKTVTINRYA